MIVHEKKERRAQIPRPKETYRQHLRNNAKSWKGVEPDKIIEHPPLVMKMSARGEVHYV